MEELAKYIHRNGNLNFTLGLIELPIYKNPIQEEIIITYEDDGPGVPLDRKDKIFDPFYTTKDIGEGTGLGLFMVANIIEERQGRIELDTNYQNGARFVIYLPVSPNSILAKET
jgi:signal transduction histidine kinase